ncbi:MAG: LysR family transcriptional regulator [Fibrobacter sp.]|jgi:DNA-binding transcriptional LysR family regulator|uniref:LysR family transcriptional regulator n=1 Tax=Fibrobacter sp. TaxID=35828 RepID=UPI001B1AC4D0|nr:LysR family transcriptional regulator [Fibrobacter sp.]MBO5533303.1 LysR family transcriptional regulator [Fibrobacter sp.]MDD5942616.1 LysR family transcriptional regulator [Fibrobacter sp.]MDY6265491.1 LysR family transcriptional regulator [Fibrobacter sp.]
MELTHLKYFLEVARTEHVTQSAKTLCIVQPALTHALHKLEEELGVKLFKTQGRNIKLTEIGEYFYKKVKPLYEDIESLPAQLRAMENEQSATVNLNVLAASSFVTNAVILYKRNDPDLRFNLVQNEETTLYDICVRTYANYKASVRHYGGEDSEEENFVCTENIYLAVPNTAQYRKRDSISLKELQETNFIGLYGSKQLRSIFNEYCERIGFKTHITFESDNALAVKDAIASGIGVGFWPEFSWGRVNNRRIRLLKITDAEFKRDIVITLRKNKQDNSRSERFYQFLTGLLRRASSRRRG